LGFKHGDAADAAAQAVYDAANTSAARIDAALAGT
jgi:hypothetical protein